MFDEAYEYIDHFGLNTTRIFIVLGLCILIMMFAFREIFAWFMKTGRIAKQFKTISTRLERIESKLEMLTLAMEQETEPTAEPLKKQFELRH